jgi:hypothetical protein
MLVGLEFNMSVASAYSNPNRNISTTKLVLTGEKLKWSLPSWTEYANTAPSDFPSGWRFAGMEIGIAADMSI